MKLIFILDGLGDTMRPSPLKRAKTPYFSYLCGTSRIYKFKAFSKEDYAPRSDEAFAAFLGLETPERGALEAFGDGCQCCEGMGFKCIFARRREQIVVDRKPLIDTQNGKKLVLQLSQQFGQVLIANYQYQHRFSVVTFFDEYYQNDPEKDGDKLHSCTDCEQMYKLQAQIDDFLSLNSIAKQFGINTVLFRLPGRMIQKKNELRYNIISDDSVIYGLGIGCQQNAFKIDFDKTTVDEVVKFISKHERQITVLHCDKTDAASHAGDFNQKVSWIEKCDAFLAKLVGKIHFDEIIITGDHPTPCSLRLHDNGFSPLLHWNNEESTTLDQQFNDECAEQRDAIIGPQLLQLFDQGPKGRMISFQESSE